VKDVNEECSVFISNVSIVTDILIMISLFNNHFDHKNNNIFVAFKLTVIIACYKKY